MKSYFIFTFLIKGRTHCVDTTITNILEGRVSYIPEKEGNEVKSNSDVKSTSSGLSSEVEWHLQQFQCLAQSLLIAGFHMTSLNLRLQNY